jgi:uncharacterized protein YjiS (DUF1127 family)
MTRNPTMPALPAIGSRFRQVIAVWRARHGERQALAVMTDRELRDIGLSPGEAIAEARKPFWAG